MAGDEFIEISNDSLLSKNPVVSVLMITFNHEKYIGQAIDAIVSQITDFSFELVIGEDCSTDATRQLAFDYQKRYPNIIRILFSERNVGVNRNYARVLLSSRGQFIACCEGDDYWTDDRKLQKQVDLLLNHSEFVAAYHDSIMIDQFNNISPESALGDRKYDYTSRELQATRLLPTQTICFRNVLKELPQEFFEVLAADAFIISMLGSYGGAKYMDDVKPSVYRQHPGGVWSQTGMERKTKEIIITNYWLAVYYRRAGNIALSVGFARVIVEFILRKFEVGFLSILKSLGFVYMSTLYRILRNTRNLFRKNRLF